MKTEMQTEPRCVIDRSHSWIVRALGGDGFIEEMVCANCHVVATRVPPVIRDGELVEAAGFAYNVPASTINRSA